MALCAQSNDFLLPEPLDWVYALWFIAHGLWSLVYGLGLVSCVSNHAPEAPMTETLHTKTLSRMIFLSLRDQSRHLLISRLETQILEPAG